MIEQKVHHSKTIKILQPSFKTPSSPMDDFYFRKSYVPAFGNWDCNGGYDYDDLQFTQCFESARQAGLFRYSYSEEEEQDRDLYVAGDLYENDIVTPTMIVVPRRRRRQEGKGGNRKGKLEGKKKAWVVCDYEGELKAPPSPDSASLTPPRRHRASAKAVDEDLYKISPDLLRAQTKRKKAWGFFSSCLQPTCV